MRQRLYLVVCLLAVMTLTSCAPNIVKTVLYLPMSILDSYNDDSRPNYKKIALYYGVLYFIGEENASYDLYSRSLENVYQGSSNPSQASYAMPNYLYEVREKISLEQLRKLFYKNGCAGYYLISNVKLPKECFTTFQEAPKGTYYTIEECSKQKFLRIRHISNKEIEFPSSSVAVNKYRKPTESPKFSDFIKTISMDAGTRYYYIISRHP